MDLKMYEMHQQYGSYNPMIPVMGPKDPNPMQTQPDGSYYKTYAPHSSVASLWPPFKNNI